jgi:hypothetical protein
MPSRDRGKVQGPDVDHKQVGTFQGPDAPKPAVKKPAEEKKKK